MSKTKDELEGLIDLLKGIENPRHIQTIKKFTIGLLKIKKNI